MTSVSVFLLIEFYSYITDDGWDPQHVAVDFNFGINSLCSALCAKSFLFPTVLSTASVHIDRRGLEEDLGV